MVLSFPSIVPISLWSMMHDVLAIVRRQLIVAIAAAAAVLPGAAAGKSAAEVFARVSGSVVVVMAADAGGAQMAQGSGVVVGANEVATNCHVVARAAAIAVRQAADAQAREMAWMADEYRQLYPSDIDALACVTGKPVTQGGIPGREEATGRGVEYVLREFFRHPDDVARSGLEGGLESKRVIVQGLGNVGFHAARYLTEEEGVRLVGVIERDGALLSDSGLAPGALAEHRARTGGLGGFPGARFVADGASVLEADCDILVPAAIESQITDANAPRIRARLIVEATNGPVTLAAERQLLARGKVILPDLLVNAGGVTVSYFEWVSNVSHMRFGRLSRQLDIQRSRRIIEMIETTSGRTVPDELKAPLLQGTDELDLVQSGLEDTMREAYGAIRETMRESETIEDLRTAAFAVALEKVVRSYRQMGLA